MAPTSKRDPAGPARGVLHASTPEGHTEHRRLLPSPALAPYLAHFWSIGWSLRKPFAAETLPHPSVHVVFERSARTRRAEVAGVHTGRFSRRLVGEGQVFGIKFRPAAFQPLLGRSMATLTNRVVPIGELWGSSGDALAQTINAARDLEAQIAVAEGFLRPLLPPLPREIASLRDLVERMEVDRAILRVEDACRIVGLDIRTLQRGFRRFVGASPKWVIQRYRLHEAAERLKGSPAPALADLAAELGYADQAHFARDFKRMVGRSPGSFARHATARAP